MPKSEFVSENLAGKPRTIFWVNLRFPRKRVPSRFTVMSGARAGRVLSPSSTMSTFRLTPGSCAQLQLSPYDGDAYTKEHVVQFLSVKKVGPGTSDRYRLIISDGTHFIQAMLATQCNALVESEEIKRFTVAAIERATCNTVQEKR